MSLGQSLSIGSTVAIFGPAGVFLYPAIVEVITPSGNQRQISVSALSGGVLTYLQLVNHVSLTADGSGWDFPSTLPSVAL